MNKNFNRKESDAVVIHLKLLSKKYIYLVFGGHVLRTWERSCKYGRCHANMGDVMQIWEMSCKYGRCHTNMGDVMQIWEMSCKYGRCHTNMGDVIQIWEMSYKYGRGHTNMGDVIQIWERTSFPQQRLFLQNFRRRKIHFYDILFMIILCHFFDFCKIYWWDTCNCYN